MFFLCQCTTAVTSSEMVVPMPSAELNVARKKPVSPYAKSTSSYLAQANTQEGAARQHALLKAAGHLIAAGKWQQGAAILAQTSDLTSELADEKNLLLAQIDLMRERPQQTLNQLAQISSHRSLSLYQQIQYHELLAKAYATTGKPLDAVKERIQLESLIADEEGQANNRRLLWLTLRL